MTDLCTCNDHVVRDCECSLEDTDCIHMDGSGSTLNPLAPSLVLDPDTDNMWSKSTMGQLVRLPSAIRNPPKCQIYRETTQAIADETGVTVAFSAERYDSDSMANLGTFASRITFTTPGLYRVTFNLAWEANTAGDRQAYIRKNGREYLGASQKRAPSTLIECGQSVTVQELFEEDEYVEAVVKQDSGGSLNLLSTRYSPTFSARYRRRTPPE